MLERTLSSDPLAKGLVAAATLSAPAVSPTSSARDNALYRRLLGALNAPLRLLFRDPLARLLTGATVGAWRLLVRATAADWAERILLRFGRAVDAFGLASRDLQTGRVRDYVLAALVGLLLLATVTGLVLWF
jgi:hypothetical protein